MLHRVAHQVGRLPDVDLEVNGGEREVAVRRARTGATFSNTQKYEEITVNVPVDGSLFKKPAS